MSTVNAQQRDLEELETIRFVTNALFEVSAESITHLRSAFEKNRLFYTEISELYRAVKQTAITRGHIEDKGVSVTHGVSVAFTSNTRFYGSINSDLMRTFLNHIKVTDRDCIVIGKTGHSFMNNYPVAKRCSYFSFVGDQPNAQEMRQFLKSVSRYKQVYVFHPAFINVFHQDVNVLDITHTPDVDTGSNDEEAIDYIFEPELPKILRFFETRVRYLLFQRAMLESQLARTAARLMAMNSAEEKATEEVKKVRLSIRRRNELLNDIRLLESFSSIKKWKK